MRRLDAFASDLTSHLTRVERHYARLFEDAPTLDVEAGSLVFTGVVDDPETLATLRRLGFQRPEAAAETIRGWHFGRRAAVQSPRAREVLTELTPALLDAFAGSGDPDAALAAFDAALARMTAAVELHVDPALERKPARTVRRRLGRRAAARQGDRRPPACARRGDRSRPRVDDSARASTSRDAGAGRGLSRPGARASRTRSNRARDFAAEEMFLIGVRLLSGRARPRSRRAGL